VDQLGRYSGAFRDPEKPGRGRFINCPLGWGCERINTLKLKAYGLESSYTNYRPGDEQALIRAVERAFERRRPILFYHWSPTWLLGVHDVVQLEEPPFDAHQWQTLLSGADDAVATAYPAITVRVGANSKFSEQAPGIAAMLSRYWMKSDTVERSLAYLHERPDADSRRAALWFLREHPLVWHSWLSEETAEIVTRALEQTESAD
jgi:ABC-type proline/glycine betaine transport system substrate-binding protein